MSTKTYNPKKVNIVYAGTEITGLAEDDFISIEPLGDGIKSVCGADGEIARAMDPDSRYKISLKLLATSAANSKLTEQWKKDRTDGSGMAPFLVKDLSGKTEFSAPEAWVVKVPNLERGKEVGTVEWELETGATEEINIAGSDK